MFFLFLPKFRAWPLKFHTQILWTCSSAYVMKLLDFYLTSLISLIGQLTQLRIYLSSWMCNKGQFWSQTNAKGHQRINLALIWHCISLWTIFPVFKKIEIWAFQKKLVPKYADFFFWFFESIFESSKWKV